MNIDLNLTYPTQLKGMPVFSSAYIPAFANTTLLNLQKGISSVQRNHIVAAASLMAVNFALIHLSDRLIRVASRRFELDCEEETGCSSLKTAGRLLFKGIVLWLGVSGYHKLLNTGFSRLYLAATVVIALASQVIWQTVIQPALNSSRQVTPSKNGSGKSIMNKKPNEKAFNMSEEVEEGDSPSGQRRQDEFSLKDKDKISSPSNREEDFSLLKKREELSHDADLEGLPKSGQSDKVLPEESIFGSQVLENTLEGVKRYK